jgi:hypothetical protein
MKGTNIRTAIISVCVLSMLAAAPAVAGERDFDLDLDRISLEPPPEIPDQPRPDPRTEARRAMWNDPMTRWMYQLNQQQAWIMRGTMPGSDRVTGAVVSVKAQGGLPLHLVASSQLAGIDVSEQRVEMVRWPWEEDESPPVMALEEQISMLLGQRLEAAK